MEQLTKELKSDDMTIKAFPMLMLSVRIAK